jgi:Tfp pilus assembly protein PilZ
MKQDRVLVTHDDDFLRIHAEGTEHAGIVYVHQKRLTIGQTVLALLALQGNPSAESMAGRVEFHTLLSEKSQQVQRGAT